MAVGLAIALPLGLLAPAEHLLQDEWFWGRQSEGLAVFAAEDFFARYRLPVEFDQRLVVADHFHLVPLLPLLRRAIAERRLSGELHTGRWHDVGTVERLNSLDAQLRRAAQVS